MGKCIEIEMADDGSITVAECEPKGEMMSMEGGESSGQQFQDIGEALRYAGSLLIDHSAGATSAAFSEGGDEMPPEMMMRGKGGM